LALFRADVSDDIFSVSPTGTTGLFFQNVGGTRRQGVEVSLASRPAAGLEARLSYTYTEATFRDNLELATPRLTAGCAASPCTQTVRAGNDLPLVPRHRLNASLDYRLAPGSASGSGPPTSGPSGFAVTRGTSSASSPTTSS